tara:strand:+ start:959 stop:1321 length:363 start_codon:yes stop_codon:yes gene_type:complete
MAKLLIVDDDEISARFFGEILTSLGHVVIAVGNASDAFDVIAREGTDLVLMDLEMPGINGVEATREIKRNKAFQDVPVLILSAHAEAQAFEEVRLAGADGYIHKHCDRTTLEQKVDEALS